MNGLDSEITKSNRDLLPRPLLFVPMLGRKGGGRRPELLSDVLCLNEKCVCECVCVCCSHNAQNASVGSGRAGCLLQQQQLNEHQQAGAGEAGVWSRPAAA